MFDSITFKTFGRCIMNKNWYIAPLSGINRIYYIHSGSVLYSSGQKTHMLTPGKIYFFPQNMRFELITDDSTNVDHTYFDFLTLPALSAENIINFVPMQYPVLKAAAEILFKLAEENKNTQLLSSYLDNFLCLMSSEFAFNIISDIEINKAVDYIHQNFNQKISVKQLASMYNMEINVFIRKFKKHIGVTPFRYIKNHRINNAMTLIRNGGLTLDEIAALTGYSDAASLSHSIKSSVACKNGN